MTSFVYSVGLLFVVGDNCTVKSLLVVFVHLGVFKSYSHPFKGSMKMPSRLQLKNCIIVF